MKAVNESDKTKTIVLSTLIDNIEYAYPVYAKIDPSLVISQYGKFPKKYGSVIVTDEVENYKTMTNTLILEK